jgi:hypothetical protein
MNEITSKLFRLVKEEGISELNAWNQTSQQLISVARVSNIFFFNLLDNFDEILNQGIF